MHAMIPAKVEPVKVHSGLRKAMFGEGARLARRGGGRGAGPEAPEGGYKNKAHDWEHPTWEWLLKRKSTAPNYVILSDIKVIAWDQESQPVNQGLTQFFSPDKEGEKGAHLYAKSLIEDGYAILSEVVWSVRFSYSGDEKLVQYQTYQRADL